MVVVEEVVVVVVARAQGTHHGHSEQAGPWPELRGLPRVKGMCLSCVVVDGLARWLRLPWHTAAA